MLLNPDTGAVILTKEVFGVLFFEGPWPWRARTIWNDHSRFSSTYFRSYEGQSRPETTAEYFSCFFGLSAGFYFTGDSAFRDAAGDYVITGVSRQRNGRAYT